MDSKNIEELLTRYWNCETSLEEEQQLRKYFRGGHIPDNQNDTAALFRYFEIQKKKSVSEALVDVPVLEKDTLKKNNTSHVIRNTMRMAAGIVVLAASVWLVHNEINKDLPQELKDTHTNPQLAFEETKKALLMISRNFGLAEEQAKKINLFNEAQEKVHSENSMKN
jgi:hypothetical protein